MKKQIGHTLKRFSKVKVNKRLTKALPILFIVLFGGVAAYFVVQSRAAAGLCSNTDVIGSSTTVVTAPETAQYKLWVRMQVPDATNTNNTNGVRIELAGNTNQCFTVTTTDSTAVNQWKWVNSDALASSTAHITSSMSAGTYNAKVLGLKSGVKVDKVLLLKSDSTCVPSNDFSNGQPGENCTTPAPIVVLSATPTSVVSGSSSTLTWSSTDATSCTASGGWTGSKTTSGSQTTGALTQNRTYTLTCTGIGGTGNASATVTVTTPPVPVVTFTASPTSVVSGSSSTLTWSSTDATSCTASGGWTGSKTTSGSQTTGALTQSTTYSLACTGAGGTDNETVTVMVTSGPPANETTPPNITMLIDGVNMGSKTNITIKNKSSFVWQPQATDASGIKNFLLRVNNNAITLTNGSITLGSNKNGDFNLYAEATDNFDNQTAKSLLVKLRSPDFNRSGKVDIFDLTPMLANWGKTDATAATYDMSVNGTVDIFDLSNVLAQWGQTY